MIQPSESFSLFTCLHVHRADRYRNARRRPIIFKLYFFCAPTAFAQSSNTDQHPKVEYFAGYSASGYFDEEEPLVVVNQLSDKASETGFTMAFGGGLDIRASKRISIRSMIDYNPTFLKGSEIDSRSRQDHVRLSIGILFH